jgi:glycosyltransferase involved in cell wall biosynthesis
MKILIDEGLSTLQQLGGIGYFSESLWRNLKKYAECDITDYRYLKGFPRVVKRACYLALANIEPYKQKYDIIHYQNYYLPSHHGRAARIVTIHDMAGLRCPEVYPSWYNIYFRKIITKTSQRSDAITVSSYAIRDDLFNFFPGLSASRIFVCHHGIRPQYFDGVADEKYLKTFLLDPKSYFLYVGNLETRKNLQFVLKGFIDGRSRGAIHPLTKLVLVGKTGAGYEELAPLIAEENNIIHLGRLDDAHLLALYKYCKAFVFPSRYEGFGVPILEAMSQNVPIIISDIPSSVELHERHNKQCFVFNLNDVKGFLDLLSFLDSNGSRTSRELNYGDLSVYSYSQVAANHFKVYQQFV